MVQEKWEYSKIEVIQKNLASPTVYKLEEKEETDLMVLLNIKGEEGWELVGEVRKLGLVVLS